ncbi:ABC transporter ATP-binding protein [Thiocapsa rosea]|uniref:Putative ABC transport system ATP-binding protein n=1 Tax=Thiocapsa rosea TaxID=69360 RepID=A0A495VB44_9GAMM|nr:ABC transporter ATP-binding protein [Thiocapsa rosea]RKT46504.1 putative ABC transport system ATP-binding protein [Thiocapsa rosea]
MKAPAFDSPSADQPVLRIRDLQKFYREGEGATEHRVLDGINFDVGRGECVALLGRSGSGKSTLLNLLAGIDRPDQGRVDVMGHTLSTLGEPGLTLLRRRQVGFIYQFFNLIPTLTVAENLALPLELNGTSLARGMPRITEMLERLGLAGRARAFPDQLSGGEQQRVAIGRALIHSPALVLADEPTGNLDVETGEQILALLAELFADRRRTLILVTHSLAVSRIADRVLTLDKGQLVDSARDLAW